MMVTRKDGRVNLTKVKKSGTGYFDGDRVWNGELKQPGVETGTMRFVALDGANAYTSRHVIDGDVDNAEHFATIHVEGRSYWAGLPPTPRGYAKAKMIVVRLIRWDDDTVEVEPLFEMPGQPKRFTPPEAS
jgi:hypothetical protein